MGVKSPMTHKEETSNWYVVGAKPPMTHKAENFQMVRRGCKTTHDVILPYIGTMGSFAPTT